MMWKVRTDATKETTGYRHVYCPDYPGSNKKGWVFEHRLVMANHLGRVLESTELVHHINENRLDNRLENLEIMTPGQHMSHHVGGKKQFYGQRLCACGCGQMVTTPDKSRRPVRYLRGHQFENISRKAKEEATVWPA